MSQFSIRRPVTVFMLVMALLIGGGFFALKLPVEKMPELQFPAVSVVTSVPGATPSEVEELVSKPIESSLASIENVDTISSQSQEGSSIVTVQFNWGIDLDQATIDIRDSLDSVRNSLPDSADSPRILKMDVNASPIINLSLTGDMDVNTLKPIAEDVVQPSLERIAGVASVDVAGGQDRLIRITLDPMKMESYGITLDQVTQALSAHNLAGSAGAVAKGSTEIQIRIQGEYKAVSEMGETPIPVGSGIVKLKEISTIEDGFSDVTSISTYNGQPSINIAVTKASGGNTLQIAQAVKENLEPIRQVLPEGTTLELVSDSSESISDSLNLLVEHTILGFIIAAIVLLLFLNSAHSALIATIVIPISFVATFIMMYFTNQTINIISLAGLLLGLGSFVDFSVVIIENIFRQRHERKSMLQAAIEGSKQIGNAVMASALAQIVVFLPVLFVEGLAGQLFIPLALTVIFSHIAALVVSLMLVPMLSSRFLPKVPDESVYTSGTYRGVNPIIWFNIGFEKFKTGYSKMLHWSINHRKTVIAVTLLMFIGAGAMTSFVKMEFIPSADEGEFTVSVELPNGTKLEETKKVVQQIENEILKIPELDRMTADVGSGGGYSTVSPTNVAELEVILVEERTRSTAQIVSELRGKVASIPDAEVTLSESEGLSGGAAVQVNLRGDDMDVLRELSGQLVAQIKNIEGTVNVASTLDSVRKEFEVTINRQLAARHGLSAAQILAAVRTSFDGSVATTYRTGDDQIDVQVSLPEQFKQDSSYLEKLRITTAQGLDVPLSAVATLSQVQVPDTITRENQTRQVEITGDIDGRDVTSVNREVSSLLSHLQLPEGYSVDTSGGEEEQMMESFISLGIAMLLSIALIYMVMAGQFESLLTPFVIMFSIPPTFIGVVLGLVLTGTSLSVLALIGYIMLTGLVVNNAIVMIDFIIQLRQEGMDRKQAIMLAASERLRPILMTMLATVLALLPVALSHEPSNEEIAPMAVVVVFGLSFSSLITLILIPVVYIFLDNMTVRRKRRKMKRQQNRDAKKQEKLVQNSIQP
ncbi:efflux RND transporter permease subunit [Paenibacillus sp. P96]|uniref:Efflux RND transporter permease subunit n=1 Tax=Paenibacillus zeirhizosphaerae TaxID=2987519 RepID=A0ABT9FVU1_9BACL|nr:efflux RND transporter permease subunit [Paenibacillus sp. P96]MDP4098815.1 efflux RND transporter permease subunit [Paenibacillus sp. P96]